MGKKIHDEELKLNIIVNGNEAQKQLGELEASKRALKKQNDELTKAKNKLAKAGKEESEEFKKLKTQLTENRVALSKNSQKQKDLRKELGLTGLNMSQLRKEQRRLKTEMNNFTPGSKKYKELVIDLAKVENQMGEVRSATDELKNSLNDDQAFNKGREAFTNIFDGVKTGDLGMVKEGLGNLKSGIQGMTKAALSFIATPLGAAIAVIVGIGAGAKAWIDFNIAVEKSNQLIRDITGTTGETTNAIRVRAEALNEVFEVDMTESIETAKAMVKGFGISYDEAFDLVEDSYARGAKANKEFGTSVQEFSNIQKKAGFTAKENVALINTAYAEGLQKDKLIDSIHEVDTALTEATPAARAALENAFGKQFTDKLLKGVKKGSISTKDAMSQISQAAKKGNLDTQQYATLTADIFKSAAEDIGGAKKVLEVYNKALNEGKKPLTETQKLKQKEVDTLKELKGLTTQIFASNSEGFGNMIQSGKIWINQVLIKMLRGGVDLYNWFVNLNNQSGSFSAVLKIIGKVATNSFEVLGILISNAWESLKGLGDIVAGIFTFDMDKIKQGFTQGMSFLPNAIKDIKDKAVNDVDEIYDAFQGKDKMKTINLKAIISEKNEKETTETTTTDTKTPAEIEAAKKLKEKQAELFRVANEEINKLIAEQQLAKKTALEQEIAGVEAKYKKEIALAKKHNLTKKQAELEAFKNSEIDALREQKRLEDEAKRKEEIVKEQEKLAALTEIENENYLLKEEQRLDREIEKEESEEEKALLMLEKIQHLADEELRIEENKELAKLENLEGSEEMKEAVRAKYRLQREKNDADFDKNYKKQVKANKKKGDEEDKKTREQKLKDASDMFGELSGLLGKHTAAGKAAAIAQTTIDTYLGAQKAYNSQFVSGDPSAIFRAVAAAGSAVATGLARVKKITSTDASVPGHEKGLYKKGLHPVKRNDGKIFNAKLGRTKTGLVTQPTLMDGNYLAGERSTSRNPEMIIDDITYSKLDPRVTEYIMSVHHGKSFSGFENGKYDSPSKVAFKSENESSTEIQGSSVVISLLTRIANATELGKNVKLVFGYDDAEKVKDLQNELDSSSQNGKVGQ